MFRVAQIIGPGPRLELPLSPHLFSSPVTVNHGKFKLFFYDTNTEYILPSPSPPPPSPPPPVVNMNHTRGLASTAQALRHTFFTPLRTSKTGLLQPKLYQNGLQLRPFQLSRNLAGPKVTTPASTLIKDESIGSAWVQVVNEEGNLDEPQKLFDVLASFDRNKFFCVQVAAAAGPSKPPICKILNKKEYRESEKAKIKAAKSAVQSTKQVELNWAIDAHDLQHRLKQLTNFLDKGRKVEVILTRKRHKRSATVDEIKNVMQSVMDTIREAGGTQTKAMEGEPGKHVILTVTKEK
ncbi:unnamed protein product [Penicillium pancosmium]